MLQFSARGLVGYCPRSIIGNHISIDRRRGGGGGGGCSFACFNIESGHLFASDRLSVMKVRCKQ